MASLETSLRNLLQRTIISARDVAEEGARAALEALAVHEADFYPHQTAEQKKLRNKLRAHARQLGDVQNSKGEIAIDHLVNECAYEHWHRMLFARFLVENNLLIEPSEGVPISLQDCEVLANEAGVELWAYASRCAQKMLPQIFRSDDPVLQIGLASEHRLKLEEFLKVLPPAIFKADDALGWVYQFWQTLQKDNANSSGRKIGANELPSVTQLFTDDYMVEFVLHNTLGAWWTAKSMVLGKQQSVPFKYLRLNQDGSPTSGGFYDWPRTASKVRLLDPCMGSGHFLVFALPLLVRFRIEEEDLSPAEACVAVLRDNLFGLELDTRCTQIAAFNIAFAAWKLGGYQPLPPLNLACSGTAPNTTEQIWVSLAGKDQRLQAGMERLYQLFQKAPALGSLINPRARGGELFVAEFHDLHPLLEKAFDKESSDDVVHEVAAAASGLAKAADILSSSFTLVVTNVPYLGQGRQEAILKSYCAAAHPRAKADLATCFVERSLAFCAIGGTAALVTPQSWLFQATYRRLREDLLGSSLWNFVARLGAGAFESIGGEVVNVSLIGLTRTHGVVSDIPSGHQFLGLDVSSLQDVASKAAGLITTTAKSLIQTDQLKNPETRIVLDGASSGRLLSEVAETYKGLCTGDGLRYQRAFWELPVIRDGWVFQQSTIETTQDFGGREGVFFWQNGSGEYFNTVVERLGETGVGAWIRGRPAWGRQGVAVRIMGNLPVTRYTGEIYDNNISVIVPKHEKDLMAVWAFCESPEFNISVRRLNQKMSVTDESFVQVPFDLAHWERVANDKYKGGLPQPYSNNPTQWLFNGHPRGSSEPLHVATARLLGYKWPRQTGSRFPACPIIPADNLTSIADNDGIVCIPSVRGEESAADRLASICSAAGIQTEGDLDEWLRNEFFEEHCKLFDHRPFIWHVWDGRKRDGFNALVNYHRLVEGGRQGYKVLESLTYSYLGDWIHVQEDGVKREIEGAEDRLVAAKELQKRLIAILKGEPPFDLFIRWKPLHTQPTGWEPDPNDGVRLNIRPFLAEDLPNGRAGAGILRWRPNIKWEKDRGLEPRGSKLDFPWLWGWNEDAVDFMGGKAFTGERFNACHYSNAVKLAAQSKKLS